MKIRFSKLVVVAVVFTVFDAIAQATGIEFKVPLDSSMPPGPKGVLCGKGNYCYRRLASAYQKTWGMDLTVPIVIWPAAGRRIRRRGLAYGESSPNTVRVSRRSLPIDRGRSTQIKPKTGRKVIERKMHVIEPFKVVVLRAALTNKR